MHDMTPPPTAVALTAAASSATKVAFAFGGLAIWYAGVAAEDSLPEREFVFYRGLTAMSTMYPDEADAAQVGQLHWQYLLDWHHCSATAPRHGCLQAFISWSNSSDS